MKLFRDYYKEISRNQVQKDAVDCEKNAIVIAGPGSGKTRIVSVKAASLRLQKRGVACISFGNPTENQIRDHLLEMGIREDDHLFIGTVHNFCLQFVVRPFLPHLAGKWLEDFSIASQDFQIPEILEIAKVQQSFTKIDVFYLQKLQRKLTAKEVSEEDNLEALAVVEAYEKLMVEQNLVDFEMIVRWAVDAIESSEAVRSYIRHHFEWFIIDEYQDLGGALHFLAKLLLKKVGIRLLIVGDPDQLIFHFNGSDKRYFQEYLDWKDVDGLPMFEVFKTGICYRFGRKLIAASAGALNKVSLPYTPDENIVKSDGIIEFHEVSGSKVQQLTEHVTRTILPSLLRSVKAANQIAILYTGKGEIVDVMRTSLEEADISYIDEKDGRLPSSPIVTWIRQCADWVIAYVRNDNQGLNVFPDVAQGFVQILKDADISLDEDNITYVEERFRQILVTTSSLGIEVKAQEWLPIIISNLNLLELLRRAGNRKGDIRDLQEVQKIHSPRTLLQLGANYTGDGVILTTIHSSKGREFDHVVLIGVQHGVIPWKKHEESESFRNQFYVACTRAKQSLNFVYSKKLKSPRFNQYQPPSPYLNDVKNSLRHYESS